MWIWPRLGILILQIEMSVLYFCTGENLMAVIQYQKKTP